MTRTHNSRLAAWLAVSMVASLMVVVPANQARSAPSELFISEYVEGSANNKAIEIYNGTGATVDLFAYTLELYSNGASSPSQTAALSGSLADGDVFVIAHPSADPAIVADATSGSVINFNGDDALVLRNSGAVVDSFGQTGFDPGSEWPGGGEDDTLRRAEAVCVGDTNPEDLFDASVEWVTFGQDTFDGLGAHMVTCDDPPAPDAVINEFSASTTGTDVEYVEVYGPASTDFSDLTILEIEGDGTGAGTVDHVIPVGTTDTNGLWLADLPANALENGTITLLLVRNFTGSLGEDLDTNDDGTLDTTPWDEIADATAVNDGGAGDQTYGEPVLTANYDGLPFTPGGASRIPDGEDTDTTGDWVRNDFDLAGIDGFTGTPEEGEALNTPGEPNQAVEPPPPSNEGIFFSEYIEGSSNNKALEIFNGSGSAIDLSIYTLELYSNGAASASQTTALSGSLADGEVHVLAHGSADAAILAFADQISSSVINFNGDDALVLRDNGDVVDSFGQVGFDPGSEWPGGGQNDTLIRKAGITGGDTDPTDAFDASLEWDVLPEDTFDGLGFHGEPPAPTAVINEFSASTTGTDVEYVEVYGPPSTDFSDLTILEIEGDPGGASSNWGVVDHVIPVGTTDADGFWLADLPANALENGTITLLLVRNFTGSLGDDLDPDDDGTLNTTPWDEVVDAVAVDDGDTGDHTYGQPVLTDGYDGLPFAPGGASRIPDGEDTDTTDDWVRNDFDLAGIDGFTGTPEVGEALNTPGAPNQAIDAPPPPPLGVCTDPATFIYEVQGSGAASPLAGTTVVVEGIVVGDFQNNGEPDNGDLDGFHVQEEDTDADGNPATSDGVFVFAPVADDVSLGDLVRLRGSVSEFNGMTEITIGDSADLIVCSEGNDLPGATEVLLPVDSPDDFEAYEGMRVTFPQDLAISEYFNFDRFGEIVVTLDRQLQPTAIFEPGSPEAAALADLQARSRVLIDDGRTVQNPDPAIHPNGDEFDLDNLFRGGDLVANVTGVLNFGFGLYRVQPTEGADYTPVNHRPESHEEVGGTLEVASFNVLNYFTTLDTGPDICGPAQNQDCRGANDAVELERQQAKIVAALAAMDSDVVGLIEIENHPGDDPTTNLVGALNDAVGAGTYDYIATGAVGTDAIRQALIYKPATVEPLGDFAILDTSVDPRFDDTRNRPVIAQTFRELETGGVFTVAVNHLKSKGSACGAGDDDPEQGNCNLTRTEAAEALVDWLATDPTGSGDDDILIIGDLNAYDKEDPIDVIVGTGYSDLVFQYEGEDAYSFVFDGKVGYLDHALANAGLADQVTGATEWHINADEADLIDYDTSFKLDAQDAIYAPDPYRSSDHDPVIVGLGVCDDVTAPEISVDVDKKVLWPPNHHYRLVNATVDVSDDFDSNPMVELVSVTSSEPDNGFGDGHTINDIVIVDDDTFLLRAERSAFGSGRDYTITYRATDNCGNTAEGTATVRVPRPWWHWLFWH